MRVLLPRFAEHLGPIPAASTVMAPTFVGGAPGAPAAPAAIGASGAPMRELVASLAFYSLARGR